MSQPGKAVAASSEPHLHFPQCQLHPCLVQWCEWRDSHAHTVAKIQHITSIQKYAPSKPHSFKSCLNTVRVRRSSSTNRMLGFPTRVSLEPVILAKHVSYRDDQIAPISTSVWLSRCCSDVCSAAGCDSASASICRI